MWRDIRTLLKWTMNNNAMITGEKKQGKKRLFLETTAQICRLSGVPGVEERVNKILKQYVENHSKSNQECKLITSTVVYAQFLTTVVKDILLIRDLVKEEFLDKNRFDLSLHEIDKSLSVYPKIQGKRAKRIFAVTGMLNMEFIGFESIETRRVIRFLDTTARNLAFKDFFEIRIGGKRIKIEEDSPCYLNEIGCLTRDPLQEECSMKNKGECRHKIDVPYFRNNDHDDKCLVIDSSITKCQGKPREYCDIEKFFRKKDVLKNLELLKIAVNENNFSSKFRNKTKNKKWLACFKEWDFTKNEFEFRGQNCWRYFFDILIVLQCPDDAAILSNDPDFGELGKAIGRNDIWVSF